MRSPYIVNQSTILFLALKMEPCWFGTSSQENKSGKLLGIPQFTLLQSPLAFLEEGNILAGMARDDLERPPSKDIFNTSGGDARFVLWSMPNGEELLRDKIDAWQMRVSPESGLLATARHDSIMVWQIF